MEVVKLYNAKVLVACPTHVIKEYAMDRWLENVNSFSYENKTIMLVDNSTSDAFYERYKHRALMLRIKGDRHLAMKRVTMSMEVIRRHFISNNYDYWFNLEIDVLPKDKDVIQKMLHYSIEKDIDLVNYAYPSRKNTELEHLGVGCSMISRQLAGHINYNEAGDVSPDGWLWGKVRNRNAFKMADIWHEIPILHIDE